MKRLLLQLGLCAFISSAYAATPSLDAVQSLGQLNGQALACSQKDNIKKIKSVMINYAPKSRQHGASFEQATHEAFLDRSNKPEECSDASLIALKVEDITNRLREASASAEKH